MRLSFSTNAFVRLSVFDAIQSIAAIGYPGVELLADVPHLYAESVTHAELERLRNILKATGLRVANINANTAVGYYGREFWEPLFEPSLAHPDEHLRKWRIAYTKKCIDMADVLGAPCVSVTSGKFVPGTAPGDSLELLRRSLDELLPHATSKSILIAIEYEPGLIIERFEEVLHLIELVDCESFGVNLDLGHSHVQCESPKTVISALSPRIFHVHVEDIRDGKHYHLIPGTGQINFPNLFSILTENGYEGFVSVELYSYPHQPEAAAVQSFNFLNEVWEFS
jgi:protein FrlC